jgi:two-component system LytT family response regulator
MPNLNGFEVLTSFSTQPIVVFTTAYDQYALKAFSVNSVDYLLKPVQFDQLERALAKIEHLRSLGTTSQQDLRALIKNLANSLQQARPDYPNRIASRLGDRL